MSVAGSQFLVSPKRRFIFVTLILASNRQSGTHDSRVQCYQQPIQNEGCVLYSLPRVIEDAFYASKAMIKTESSVQGSASRIGSSLQDYLLIAIDEESTPFVQGAAIKLAGYTSDIDDLLQLSLPVASHSLLAVASTRYDNHQQEPTSNPPANSVNLAQECGSRGSVGDTGILADALSQPGAPDPQDLSNRRIAESPNRRGAHFAE